MCQKTFNNFRKTPNLKHRSKTIGKIQFSKIKYCSMKCTAKGRIGMKFSKEHRENISKANLKNPRRYWLGKKLSREHREKIGKRPYAQGKDNVTWRGDEAGYSPIHIWVVRWKGRPNICEHCGKKETRSRYIDWANIDHKYKRRLSDYIRLCKKCHRRYDKDRKESFEKYFMSQ
jgi:hypothetical protein